MLMMVVMMMLFIGMLLVMGVYSMTVRQILLICLHSWDGDDHDEGDDDGGDAQQEMIMR